MTGNLVLLGFALGGTVGFNVGRTLTSLIAFTLGAWTAGRLSARWQLHPGRLLRRMTAITATALLGCAALIDQLAVPATESTALLLCIIALLAWTMGLVNATARALGMRDIPTTVATSTISDLAAGAARDAPLRTQLVRAAAIVVMLAGAGCGAALLHHHDATAAFAVAPAAAVLAVILQLHARRRADQALRAD